MIEVLAKRDSEKISISINVNRSGSTEKLTKEETRELIDALQKALIVAADEPHIFRREIKPFSYSGM